MSKYDRESVESIMDKMKSTWSSEDSNNDTFEFDPEGESFNMTEHGIFSMLKELQDIIEKNEYTPTGNSSKLPGDANEKAKDIAYKIAKICIDYINGHDRHKPEKFIERSIGECKCNTFMLVLIIISTLCAMDYKVISLFRTSGLNVWLNPIIILIIGLIAFISAYFVIFTSNPEKIRNAHKSNTCISSCVQALLVVTISFTVFEAIYCTPDMDELLKVFIEAYVHANEEIVQEFQKNFHCCGISDKNDHKIYATPEHQLKCPHHIKKHAEGCQSAIKKKFDSMQTALMYNFLMTIFDLTILLGLSSSYLVRWGDQFPYNVLAATAQYLFVSKRNEELSKSNLRRYLEQIYASTVLQSSLELSKGALEEYKGIIERYMVW